MRVAGLSGGIATGKSFVVSIWLEHHVLVIECDAVARDVLRNVSLRTVCLTEGQAHRRGQSHVTDGCLPQGRWAYQRVVRHFGSAVVLADGAPCDVFAPKTAAVPRL